MTLSPEFSPKLRLFCPLRPYKSAVSSVRVVELDVSDNMQEKTVFQVIWESSVLLELALIVAFTAINILLYVETLALKSVVGQPLPFFMNKLTIRIQI
jgi:hypothetical protein